MKNLFDELKVLLPEISRLDQQPILDEGKIVGWSSLFCDFNNNVICEGTSEEIETSKRIAIAEAFEKGLVRKIANSPLDSTLFLINEFPSSSGFACGFEENPTKYRSICESIERWIWSKWIDEHFILPKVNNLQISSLLTKRLLKTFTNYQFFQKQFALEIPRDGFRDFKITIFIGFDEKGGIFPGSRVGSITENTIDHPVIEAYRNYLNYKNHLLTPFSDELIKSDIILERILFFAENGSVGTRQIEAATKLNWPTPNVRLHKSYTTSIPSVYLYRTLLFDFCGWHLGHKARFVY